MFGSFESLIGNKCLYSIPCMRIPRKEIEKLLNAGYVEKKNANETFNYILLYIIISSYALSNTLRTNIIRKDEF